jgi:hypothetical protein
VAETAAAHSSYLESQTLTTPRGAAWVKVHSGRLWERPRTDSSSGIHTRSDESWSAHHTHVRHPVVLAPPRASRRAFAPTSRWEGTVLERFDSYFSAEVVDLDNDEVAVAEFDLGELSSADISLCEPGALFYWTTGYETKDSGQKSRSSVIAFRRTGRKTPE